jgi:hypothetical protein
VFAGQRVGIREVSEKIWLVSFMHYDLGFFDEEVAWSAPKIPSVLRCQRCPRYKSSAM